LLASPKPSPPAVLVLSHRLCPSMSTVYAVAPRPATPAPLSASSSSSSSSPHAYVNPAQVQNAQAGPSSQCTPIKLKTEPATPAKRKRTDRPEDSATEESQRLRKTRDGPKKKKANRACFHCQKAHLTCDDCTFFVINNRYVADFLS